MCSAGLCLRILPLQARCDGATVAAVWPYGSGGVSCMPTASLQAVYVAVGHAHNFTVLFTQLPESSVLVCVSGWWLAGIEQCIGSVVVCWLADVGMA